MRAEIETLYFDKCCGKLKVESEKVKALDNVAFNTVNNAYIKAIDGVLNTPKYGNKNYELSTSLKRNVSTFTAFRNHYFNELLSKNKPDVHEKIVAMHYRYLETEKALVSRTTRSAKQWVEYERTADIYPNLEYLSSRSADKRDTHKELYGTIRPINDPFWDTHLPPNGWGCKCRTRKTDATPTTGNMPSITLPKGIIGNAGKSGVVFAKDHSLINNVSDSEKKQIKKDWHKQIRKNINTWAKENLTNKSFKNAHFKQKIILNTTGRKEIINQPHEFYYEKNVLLHDLDIVMKKAKYVKTIPFNKEKKGAKEFVKIHYFSLKLNKKTSYIVIKENYKEELFLYAITDNIK